MQTYSLNVHVLFFKLLSNGVLQPVQHALL